jgi:hypothetical protein
MGDMLSTNNKIEIDREVDIDNDIIIMSIPKTDFFNNLYKNRGSTQIQQKILRQLVVDFSRQKIYLNNNYCTNIFRVLEYVYDTVSKGQIDIYNQILLLAQQTSLSIPVGILQEKITPHILGEKQQGEMMDINIFDDKVIITKKLRIMNCNNGTTISYVDITLFYMLDDNNINLRYIINSPIREKYGFEIL